MHWFIYQFIPMCFLCFLCSCVAKYAPSDEPIQESVAPLSRPNLLFVQEVEKGAYKLFVEQLDPSQHYILQVQGNLNKDMDRQEILVHPNGTVSLASMPGKSLILTFAPTLLGESFDVFLLSMDYTLLDLVHLLPFPAVNEQIEGYSIKAEVLDPTAECLFFTASGFEPNEQIVMASGLNEEDGHMTRHTASKEGVLCFIENPAYRGHQGGRRKLLMVGKKQKIETEYLWGTKLRHYSHAFFQARTKQDPTS